MGGQDVTVTSNDVKDKAIGPPLLGAEALVDDAIVLFDKYNVRDK